MFKQTSIAIAFMAASSAMAETTVYFEDGTNMVTTDDVYLVAPGTYVHSVVGSIPNGVTTKRLSPTTTAPYVEPPVVEPEFGYCEDGETEKADAKGTNCAEYVEPEVEVDPEIAQVTYCQNFDTSQGLTFEYVEWQRSCDTNKDGEYKFCEDYVAPTLTFQSVWWGRGCKSDPDFTPVPVGE